MDFCESHTSDLFPQLQATPDRRKKMTERSKRTKQENEARERSKQQNEASDRTKQVLRESIKMCWWKEERRSKLCDQRISNATTKQNNVFTAYQMHIAQ
jgi:hypothetical protein